MYEPSSKYNFLPKKICLSLKLKNFSSKKQDFFFENLKQIINLLKHLLF